MDPNAKFFAQDNDTSPNTEEALEMTKIPYQEAVGCLMYVMTTTRPDLAFPLSILCKYMAHPSYDHWKAIKRLLRYMQGTRDDGLTIAPGPLVLIIVTTRLFGSRNVFDWESVTAGQLDPQRPSGSRPCPTS